MKYPLWKRGLSYFKDVSLEQTSSLSNPYLEVLLVKDRHQLVTRDAIYSFDDKYENFSVTFEKINWDKITGKKVLLLGLGLGSVIYILEKKMGKHFDYKAVEVDSEICRLCNEYTLSSLDSYVETVNNEAMRFLEYDQDNYNIIIMDIFQSAVIPQKFQSKAFLQSISDKLNPDGMLLYNRMNITDEDKAENAIFRMTMEDVFPNFSLVKIATNMVFINDKDLLL